MLGLESMRIISNALPVRNVRLLICLPLNLILFVSYAMPALGQVSVQAFSCLDEKLTFAEKRGWYVLLRAESLLPWWKSSCLKNIFIKQEMTTISPQEIEVSLTMGIVNLE